MTATKKLDLLVEKDGLSEVVLLPQKSTPRKRSSSVFHGKLLILIFVVLLILVCFTVTFFILNRRMQDQTEYPVHLSICGTESPVIVQLDSKTQTEGIKRYGTEKTNLFSSVSDGMNEYTAVKAEYTDASTVCLVRNDRLYGRSAPPILPRTELISSIINDTDWDNLPVVVSDVKWGQQESLQLDFGSLSPALQEFCDGLEVYEMRPLPKNIMMSSDEVFFDDIDLNTMGSGDDENEDEEIIDDGGLYPPSEDEEFKRVPRQISPEETEEAAVPTPDSEREAPSGGDGLNLGDSETDHGLGCCNHCGQGYLSCSRVCIPLETRTYPYYYRNCDHVECQLYLPCSWWRARARGQI